MENINFPKRFRVYLPLIALLVLMVLLMPRTPKFHSDYRKGAPWMYETLISQFDFPILKTEAQFQEEREKVGSSVIPYFRIDQSVRPQVESRLASIDFGRHQDIRHRISAALTEIYSRGIIASSGSDASPSGLIYVQKDKRAVKVPVVEIYTQETARQKIYSSVLELTSREVADSLLTATGIMELITPDLEFDQQTTDLVHEESIDFISFHFSGRSHRGPLFCAKITISSYTSVPGYDS